MNPLRDLAASIDIPRVRTRYAVVPLGIAVVGSMLSLGGAFAPTVPIFAAMAAVAFAITGADVRALRHDPMRWLFVLLIGVALFQIAPLPPGLLRVLDRTSEEASRLAWEPWRMSRAATWRSLHRDPGNGMADVTYLLGLAAAYFAAVHAARRDALERVYGICSGSALACAFIGIAHLATGQDHLFGFYRPTQAAPPVLSPLLNGNHLAALMGAGAILWLGAALNTEKPFLRLLHGISAIFCGAVCALTLSRGGVACAVGGVVLLLALDSRSEGQGERDRRARRKPTLQTSIGYAIAGLIFAAGAWVAASSLHREYAQGDTSKLTLLRGAVALLRGHELLGYGSGAMPVVGAAGSSLDPERTFLRAESLPIDLALSVGVFVTLAVLYFGVRAFKRWLPPAGAPTTALAAWAALVSIVAHDLVDFSLYLGGVGYFAASLAGLLSGWYVREWRRALPRSDALLRWPAAVIVVLVVMLAPTAMRSSLERERDTLERSLRSVPGSFASDAARAAVALHPGDPYLPLLLGTYAVAEGHPTALRFVARSMELAPNWAQPRLLLARILALGNRRGQALVELRAVLERTNAHPGPCARAALSLRPLPTREELDRVAPRHLGGVAFLNGMAAWAPDAAYAQMADELLLERNEGFLPALQRRAEAARSRNDLEGSFQACMRMERTHPEDAAGAVCRAEVQRARGDHDGALRSLERALVRARDRFPVHRARAQLFAMRGDTAAMRRETAMMQETAGAAVERLTEAHALRGELETQLGNLRGAYAAYEVAESLAVPEHPYSYPMAVLASRMGDRQAIEVHCGFLMEREPVPLSVRQLCDPAAARRSAVADGGTESVADGGQLMIPDAAAAP
jgi:tetratricopeptide (TPR) repeat protein